ncbi:8-amino-7-oxononanoate synthase [Actinacidiphila bryophytorum]|uniref:8-amino-7-oxononanoate synthase n=1 Tax=Actinacidiphila bryophytorum TaxID=1436133 RepID=A0A9W4H8Q2_9ACTN|nr:8-amino-7-oxononanoate synthase [Actinacidiphila bryophytorum]MBM9440905.1 8-amino-7-oxononanoate synthase [Actinacidiphila bryophytorum]MBN6542509.1 8-amino-7-oxononanoate synthase [Actinacidiphila bryophytorum]CAG7658263.1 8-amino-7-oxononanoate synthase [Actinacidiphila bryophytorum]
MNSTPPAAPHSPFGWIEEHTAVRAAAGLHRELRPRPEQSPLLDLAGNDYLGLTRHPEVTRAGADSCMRWGAGATGSRLVTGSTALHAELEAEIADFTGFEAALVLASGYAANLAAVTALTGHGTLLVSDAANHASLIDGCRLSRARTEVVPHAEPDAVRKALAGHTGRAVVVSDSVFSVDGDAAPLAELAAAARQTGAALLVDDAHGLGVLGDGGRGALHAAGLAGAPDVVCTATLSKALGAQGGVVLGPAAVIDHLVNAARTFIFDTGLAPAAAGAALGALRLLRREPGRAGRALGAARTFHRLFTAAGLDATPPDACVVSLRAPSPSAAVTWAAECRSAGLNVGCFRPPSVPDGISRLRITSNANLTDELIATSAATIIAAAPRP